MMMVVVVVVARMAMIMLPATDEVAGTAVAATAVERIAVYTGIGDSFHDSESAASSSAAAAVAAAAGGVFNSSKYIFVAGAHSG